MKSKATKNEQLHHASCLAHKCREWLDEGVGVPIFFVPGIWLEAHAEVAVMHGAVRELALMLKDPRCCEVVKANAAGALARIAKHGAVQQKVIYQTGVTRALVKLSPSEAPAGLAALRENVGELLGLLPLPGEIPSLLYKQADLQAMTVKRLKALLMEWQEVAHPTVSWPGINQWESGLVPKAVLAAKKARLVEELMSVMRREPLALAPGCS